MIIKKQIFSSKLIDDDNVLWKDLKDIQFEDNDVFEWKWVDDFTYHEYGYYSFEVVRYEDATDVEVKERMARYENYLELKKEFGQ
jgi:hypothetical protein